MIETLKALADENRLRIFQLLTQEELCVCELEVILEMNQSNVSRHLAKLKSAKLLQANKGGQWVHYSIHPNFEQQNLKLLRWLQQYWQGEKVFQQDSLRCQTYISSPYTCQNITTERDVVLSALKIQSI